MTTPTMSPKAIINLLLKAYEANHLVRFTTADGRDHEGIQDDWDHGDYKPVTLEGGPSWYGADLRLHDAVRIVHAEVVDQPAGSDGWIPIRSEADAVPLFGKVVRLRSGVHVNGYTNSRGASTFRLVGWQEGWKGYVRFADESIGVTYDGFDAHGTWDVQVVEAKPEAEPPVVQAAREKLAPLGLDPDPVLIDKTKDRSWWGHGYQDNEWQVRASWMREQTAALNAAAEAGEDVGGRLDSLRRLTSVFGSCVADAQPRTGLCPSCNGAGTMLLTSACPECNGTGSVAIVDRRYTYSLHETFRDGDQVWAIKYGSTDAGYLLTALETGRDGDRDGVLMTIARVCTIAGKPTASIMFGNGPQPGSFKGEHHGERAVAGYVAYLNAASGRG